MFWHGVPAIRKEIALSMIEQFSITQRQASEKLGVTPAAICQYLSQKRGRTVIADADLKIAIASAARRIYEDIEVAGFETCRICAMCAARGISFQDKGDG